MFVKNGIRPNFFIIGAPKCGTTALSEYLRTHPNVFFSDLKEPRFFSDDFQGRLICDIDKYMKLFQSANPQQHKAIGEGTPIYLFSNNALTNIQSFQPNAKYITMIRNPVNLVISLHAQNIISGVEDIESFIMVWHLEKERKRGRHIPLSCPDPKYLYYSEWGKLGTQLQRVFDTVPSEQVEIILFDDFIYDTRSVYQKVLNFLELPDDGRQEFPRVNERRQIKNLAIHQVLSTLARFWLPAKRVLTGGKGFGLVNYIVEKWNSTTIDKQINPEMYSMLVHFYKDEILFLEELLGRDLSNWMKQPKSQQIIKS